MSTYGMWLSAAGMQVQQHRQALIANNMANAQTTGFKHDLAVVLERRVEARASVMNRPYSDPLFDAMPGGVNVRPTYTSFAQGAIESTERPLDVAIHGDGFFTVSDGQVTRYTRDGEFAVNTAGELVLGAGAGQWRVLDDAGALIVVDRELGEPYVAKDGTIRQGRVIIATLGVVTTDDKQSLRKVGSNLFEATGETQMVQADADFVPASRERSTFDVMTGMVEMIEATRAHGINARLLQMQDALTGQAISTVGRLA